MKALVLLSGGIDSFACASYFLERKIAVSCLFIDYGQNAAIPEWKAAQAAAKHLGLPIHSAEFRSGRAYGSGEILARNAFLIFAALLSNQDFKGVLSLGIHGGTGYYDCGDSFLKQMDTIISTYTDGAARLDCPFSAIGKNDIVDYGTRHRLPLEITYSCERGTLPPCGNCLSCKDRNASLIS